MTDTVKVRIALQSARELELEMSEGDDVAGQIEGALSNGDSIIWITDSKGDRHGIVLEKLAFVEVQGDDGEGGVGFTPPEPG